MKAKSSHASSGKDTFGQFEETFKEADAVERIKLAYERFGGQLVATTSGGETSAVMMHLLKEAGVRIPIIFVDTGHYDNGTYTLIKHFMDEGQDIRIYSAHMTPRMQEALHGERTTEGGKAEQEMVTQIKHEPLSRAFRELNARAWLRGIKKQDNKVRAKYPYVRLKNGMYQLHPILDWTKQQAREYMREHDLRSNETHQDITKDQATGECLIGDACGR